MRGPTGVVTEESKPTSQSPPLLYDLTSLQRDANGRFGFSAQRTLQLAQALYERHKVITYPRTDSRALPEDYQETVKGTLASLRQHPLTSRSPSRILSENWVRPNKRIFNNAKVSDHFAIIPTPRRPNTSPRSNKNSTTSSRNGFWPCSSRPRSSWSPPASPGSSTSRSRPRARSCSTPGGWWSTARRFRIPTPQAFRPSPRRGGRHRFGRGPRAPDQTTAAIHRSDPAHRHGRRRQTGRRRGTASRHERERVSAPRPPAPRSSRAPAREVPARATAGNCNPPPRPSP
jgi:hypothetical protein